ncbi:MAG: YqaE/Pmp3 family membrane protein [Verrucomicrobiota bacterium]
MRRIFLPANSPWVDHILFSPSGTTAMMTSNCYDHLNRLTGFSSVQPVQSVVNLQHNFNAASRRSSSMATLRATRAELNAAYMELTGKSLPEQRPGNDGPGNSCPLCGSDSLNRVRGLQGVKEVLICLVLCLLFLLPGVIYYVYIETVPYCSRCGHRAFKSSHKK